MASRRRFPYAPGALGWVGAAFLVIAMLCQLAAGLLFAVFVLNHNQRVVLPMIAIFLLSFAFLAVTMAVWRVAWKRSGIAPPSSIPKERQRTVLQAAGVMGLTSILGVGGFTFLALRLSGTRRIFIGLVPLYLASIGSHYAVVKMREARGLPSAGFLGWRPRHEVAVFTIVALVLSAISLLAGLFWIPN